MGDFKTNRVKHARDKVKRHVKSVHLKIKDYSCELCSFETAQMSHLNYHLKAMHDKGKKVQCQSCTFQSDDKLKLQEHIKAVHPRLFSCTICSFKTNGYKSVLD